MFITVCSNDSENIDLWFARIIGTKNIQPNHTKPLHFCEVWIHSMLSSSGLHPHLRKSPASKTHHLPHSLAGCYLQVSPFFFAREVVPKARISTPVPWEAMCVWLEMVFNTKKTATRPHRLAANPFIYAAWSEKTNQLGGLFHKAPTITQVTQNPCEVTCIALCIHVLRYLFLLAAVPMLGDLCSREM